MDDDDILTKFLRILASSFGAVSLVLFLLWFVTAILWSAFSIEMFDSLDQATSFLLLSVIAGGAACLSAALAVD